MEIDVSVFAERLADAITGEVDAGTGRRAEYAADASNYRQVPWRWRSPATRRT